MIRARHPRRGRRRSTKKSRFGLTKANSPLTRTVTTRGKATFYKINFGQVDGNTLLNSFVKKIYDKRKIHHLTVGGKSPDDSSHLTIENSHTGSGRKNVTIETKDPVFIKVLQAFGATKGATITSIAIHALSEGIKKLATEHERDPKKFYESKVNKIRWDLCTDAILQILDLENEEGRLNPKDKKYHSKAEKLREKIIKIVEDTLDKNDRTALGITKTQGPVYYAAKSAKDQVTQYKFSLSTRLQRTDQLNFTSTGAPLACRITDRSSLYLALCSRMNYNVPVKTYKPALKEKLFYNSPFDGPRGIRRLFYRNPSKRFRDRVRRSRRNIVDFGNYLLASAQHGAKQSWAWIHGQYLDTTTSSHSKISHPSIQSSFLEIEKEMADKNKKDRKKKKSKGRKLNPRLLAKLSRTMSPKEFNALKLNTEEYDLDDAVEALSTDSDSSYSDVTSTDMESTTSSDITDADYDHKTHEQIYPHARVVHPNPELNRRTHDNFISRFWDSMVEYWRLFAVIATNHPGISAPTTALLGGYYYLYFHQAILTKIFSKISVNMSGAHFFALVQDAILNPKYALDSINLAIINSSEWTIYDQTKHLFPVLFNSQINDPIKGFLILGLMQHDPNMSVKEILSSKGRAERYKIFKSLGLKDNTIVQLEKMLVALYRQRVRTPTYRFNTFGSFFMVIPRIIWPPIRLVIAAFAIVYRKIKYKRPIMPAIRKESSFFFGELKKGLRILINMALSVVSLTYALTAAAITMTHNFINMFLIIKPAATLSRLFKKIGLSTLSSMFNWIAETALSERHYINKKCGQWNRTIIRFAVGIQQYINKFLLPKADDTEKIVYHRLRNNLIPANSLAYNDILSQKTKIAALSSQLNNDPIKTVENKETAPTRIRSLLGKLTTKVARTIQRNTPQEPSVNPLDKLEYTPPLAPRRESQVKTHVPQKPGKLIKVKKRTRKGRPGRGTDRDV